MANAMAHRGHCPQASAGERVLSAEELAERERARLERLEKERLKRMRGDTGGSDDDDEGEDSDGGGRDKKRRQQSGEGPGLKGAGQCTARVRVHRALKAHESRPPGLLQLV